MGSVREFRDTTARAWGGEGGAGGGGGAMAGFRGRRGGGWGGGARPGGAGGGGGERLLGLLLLHLGQRLGELPRKPAASLGILGACVLAHYGPAWGVAPPGAVPSVRRGCLVPAAVRLGAPLPWRRLLWAPFLHANDFHLYHNMLSLIYKGFSLELQLGSTRFITLCLYLLAASQALHVGAARGAVALGLLPGESRACVVGFSGVLFGMKVVQDAQLRGETSFLGLFGVPLRYAAWVELVSIQLVHPDASFLGHLCGILAGWLWLFAAPGDTDRGRVWGAAASATRGLWRRATQVLRPWLPGLVSEGGRFRGHGRSGNPRPAAWGGAAGASTESWAPRGMSEEEQIREALRRSTVYPGEGGRVGGAGVDDLRQRRRKRFG